MRILLIYTGGTIGSDVHNGYICVGKDKLQVLVRELLSDIPDVEIDIQNPYTILSEQLSGQHISLLTGCIDEHMEGCDGIIITHGTDSLIYTACACAYAYSDTAVPIMLVSSNYVLEDERANGTANLSCALENIKNRVNPGVYIAYKNWDCEPRLYDALEVLPHQMYDDGLFALERACMSKGEVSLMHKACLDLSESPRILWLRCCPGMDYETFSALLGDSYDYILLDSYHSGTLNTSSESLKVLCSEAMKKNVPVYLLGAERGISYESTASYEDLGIIVLPRLTCIAAYMKLWLLGEAAAMGELGREEVTAYMLEE